MKSWYFGGVELNVDFEGFGGIGFYKLGQHGFDATDLDSIGFDSPGSDETELDATGFQDDNSGFADSEDARDNSTETRFRFHCLDADSQ